jgi:hypothetical protein
MEEGRGEQSKPLDMGVYFVGGPFEYQFIAY